ncbi:hypothetical protein [Mucilaginibacter sp.]|uniref:hypothetical protein n=1 Tax=Mucilaginibacter sp. TaxID=1882438 RepID=UPI002618FAB1|nr:hypothetical protein [Mucilaginibacter sp.]MDB4924011.1 hypothetical protein [Mucilaginibacter sp.]
MPNHLSILGIIHTAISILALLAAFYCLFRDGKITPLNGSGKLYILLTAITCLTAFPIMKTGHFTAAHGVAIVVLILLPIGLYAKAIRALGKSAAYIETIAMSTTLFLSGIPTIVETLTRLPISHPIASGPNDPIIQKGLMVLVVLYTVGIAYQLYKIWKKKKSAQTPDSTVKLS